VLIKYLGSQARFSC